MKDFIEGNVTEELVSGIPCETELSKDEVFSLVSSILKSPL